jgi:uncharacterized membrane protein
MLHEWNMFSLDLVVWLILAFGALSLASALALMIGSALSRVSNERPSSPLEIIASRFARGEIDEREYRRLRDAVQH